MRLETSTTAGAGSALARRSATRKLDVKQHQPGPQPRRRGQPGLAVGRLPDHVEPVGLEQGAGGRAESGMVIHDQDCRLHGAIVAWAQAPLHRG